MIRFPVKDSPEHGLPQFLGGVGRFDVFYWTAAHGGRERLIVKWAEGDYSFYWWSFASGWWADQFSELVPGKGPNPSETETILAMYECFAIKPSERGDAA